MADLGTEPGEPKRLLWGPGDLQNYLIETSRGEEFLLDRRLYPDYFSLGLEGNQSLNNLRDKTHVFEQWSTVGVNSNQRELKLHPIPKIGEHTHVRIAEVIKMAEEAEKQEGIDNVVGLNHSHGGFIHNPDRVQFSLADLYFIIGGTPIRGNRMVFLSLVAEDQNAFVFRSRDTSKLSSKLEKTRQLFESRWQHEWGSLEQINYAIAEQYGLVIYRAKKDKPLKRMYPAI